MNENNKLISCPTYNTNCVNIIDKLTNIALRAITLQYLVLIHKQYIKYIYG